MTRLRAGVIGAGVFGGYHAGKYAAHGDVDLVGVCDPDSPRADALASKLGVKSFNDAAALLDAVDAVTVASPAPSHGQLGLAALNASVHVLVEKPIAIDLSDAQGMVDVSRSRGLTLQVGHQERFVSQAMGLFSTGETPRRIVARRCNPFNERGADVSVTLDLMVHDIDLARLLAGRSPTADIRGDVMSERTPHVDRAVAEIRFANGVEAHLTASRLNDVPDRVARIEYESGVVEVDFVAKTFVNTTPHALNPDFAASAQAADSLGAGVNAFVEACLGRTAPAVSGADGLEALRIALAVDGVSVAA